MDKISPKKLFKAFAILTLSIALVACSSSSKTGYGSFGGHNGKYDQQAQALFDKANGNTDPIAKTGLLADSFYLFSKSGNVDYATKVLFKLRPNLRLILAEDNKKIAVGKGYLEYYKGNYARALNHLNKVIPSSLNIDYQKDYFYLKSQVYYKQSNVTNAAEQLIYINQISNNSLEIKNNNEKIWGMLRELTPDQLYAQQNNPTLSSELRGWLNFNYVNKKYDINQNQVAKKLESWQREYRDHAANDYIPEMTKVKPDQKFSPPKKIALLLPLSNGPFVKPARAVKNGFIAALYNFYAANNFVPSIKVYDTGKRDVNELYQLALASGAEMIVGPLTKENVKKISRNSLQVPVLALNVSSDAGFFSSKNNLFEFGLLPEDEAISAANRANFDGHHNAAIVVPNNDWGKRTADSFTRQWRNLGGNIVVTTFFNANNLDSEIRTLLGIDKSNTRVSKLKQLGVALNYTPRRRQDIDFVFVAANPNMARQIKPLLNFYYAKDLPVYAISSVYSGIVSRRVDQDLNNVIFCDMPWVLDRSIKRKKVYQAIQSKWPKELRTNPRLFALGVDAYKLTQQLGQLQSLSEIGVSGMSGILKLDNNNVVTRKLMWAKFRDGEPTFVAN